MLGDTVGGDHEAFTTWEEMGSMGWGKVGVGIGVNKGRSWGLGGGRLMKGEALFLEVIVC